MTTMIGTPVTTGAPYTQGDPIAVEYDGWWQEATVTMIRRLDSARFGLHWQVRVVLDDLVYWAYCDDNGWNFTYRKQVCPSRRVEL